MICDSLNFDNALIYRLILMKKMVIKTEKYIVFFLAKLLKNNILKHYQ